MAVSTIDSLGQLLQDLLNVAATALAPTTRGTPEIQYLSPGLPPMDFGCDSLIAFAGGIAEETTTPIAPLPATGHRFARARVNLPTIAVIVSRCWTVEPPVTEDQIPLLTTDGLQHCQDGWALWNGITQALRDGDLLGGRCDLAHFQPLQPRDPAGGLFGWTFSLRVNLDGIPEVGSS